MIPVLVDLRMEWILLSLVASIMHDAAVYIVYPSARAILLLAQRLMLEGKEQTMLSGSNHAAVLYCTVP